MRQAPSTTLRVIPLPRTRGRISTFESSPVYGGGVREADGGGL
jgi:hypothetical protein